MENTDLANVKQQLEQEKGDLLKQYQNLCEEEKKIDKQIELLQAHTDTSIEIQALHYYNEMKDFAQFVIGRLADAEHTTCTELHKRYNLPLNS